MQEYHLTTPLTDEDTRKLRAGDAVYLSGIVYTARDTAHRRMNRMIDAGEKLPFELQGAVIFYVGPTPAPPGRPIGATTPTSAYRMDAFAPRFHSLGVKATIGKGRRSMEFRQSLQDYGCVYLSGTAGAGALISRAVKEVRMLAFPELGPEAIREFRLEEMPLLVIDDSVGGELFVTPDLQAVGLEEE